MKRLIALTVTIVILAIIFARVDHAALLANLKATRLDYFTLAILAFIPQVWAIAYRWRRMVGVFVPITWGESISLILASNTMNLVLPSKLGDLSKGVFLKHTGALDLKRSMNVVVFEKMLDVAALALVMLIGVIALLVIGTPGPVARSAALLAGPIAVVAVGAVILLYFVPADAIPFMRRVIDYCARRPHLRRFHELFLASHETISLLQSRGAKRWLIVAVSLLIWLLHLGQIYLFFLSLNASVPLFQFASLVPLAIFIGLLPISIAGFGTRDAAIISFFPQYASSVMVGVAMYINLRYILPAIAGIPFLNRYITLAREARRVPSPAVDPACDL